MSVNAFRRSSKIHEKLDRIVIPRVSFDETDVSTVVQYLKQRSKELDPDGEGVNIIYLAPRGPAQPAAEDDGDDLDDFNFDDFDVDGAAVDAPAKATPVVAPRGAVTISMDGENLPLGEIIRFMCQGTGMKYRVEPYSVIIAAAGVPMVELETRIYPVNSRFF